MNAQFVDRSLLILKGENYMKKVRELGLISKENYDKISEIMTNFISTKNDGFQEDVQELSMIAAVFTETFYAMNTFKPDVLTDIKFYSENLLRILLFLYNESVTSLEYFLECSDGLKTIDIDGVYAEMTDMSSSEEFDKLKVVMLKGKLFYSLMQTILENNNSASYFAADED
jgi:hypothetical protein